MFNVFFVGVLWWTPHVIAPQIWIFLQVTSFGPRACRSWLRPMWFRRCRRPCWTSSQTSRNWSPDTVRDAQKRRCHFWQPQKSQVGTGKMDGWYRYIQIHNYCIYILNIPLILEQPGPKRPGIRFGVCYHATEKGWRNTIATCPWHFAWRAFVGSNINGWL